MTAIDRRHLLLAGLALPLGIVPALARAEQSALSGGYVSASADANGGFAARILDPLGKTLSVVALPARGHGAAWRGVNAEVVVLARRPGRFALVVDAGEGRVVRHVPAAPGRHFYGHGVFSPDCRWFFASENDFDNGRGVIGVYDATAAYRREAELPSHGIGPHELAFLSDGRRLVVANGGIRTHPDSGRRKLNLESMAPNLAYLDSETGARLQVLRLAPQLHKLSIRHLAVTPDDEVCLAMQNEGPRDRLVPLVGFQQGDAAIALAEMPPGELRRLRHYAGGAALDESGAFLAVSAPRGGLITFWSLMDRRYLGGFHLADGCGLAPAGGVGRFLISSGLGRLVVHDVVAAETELLGSAGASATAWDNHLLAF